MTVGWSLQVFGSQWQSLFTLTTSWLFIAACVSSPNGGAGFPWLRLPFILLLAPPYFTCVLGMSLVFLLWDVFWVVVKVLVLAPLWHQRSRKFGVYRVISLEEELDPICVCFLCMEPRIQVEERMRRATRRDVARYKTRNKNVRDLDSGRGVGIDPDTWYQGSEKDTRRERGSHKQRDSDEGEREAPSPRRARLPVNERTTQYAIDDPRRYRHLWASRSESHGSSPYNPRKSQNDISASSDEEPGGARPSSSSTPRSKAGDHDLLEIVVVDQGNPHAPPHPTTPTSSSLEESADVPAAPPLFKESDNDSSSSSDSDISPPRRPREERPVTFQSVMQEREEIHRDRGLGDLDWQSSDEEEEEEQQEQREQQEHGAWEASAVPIARASASTTGQGDVSAGVPLPSSQEVNPFARPKGGPRGSRSHTFSSDQR